jgi:WD40 repeat protein/ubiquitin-protein ligase
VISASEDRTLKVWDLETGAELRTLPGHSLAAKAVAVTPDGRRAVSAGEHPGSTGELKVWDLRTEPRPRNVGAHTQAVSAVVVTPDGRHAVSASDDQTLKVWSLAQGAQLHALTGHTDSVRALAATPDGRRVISGSRDRTLKVWDVASGTQLHTLAGHSREVRAVAMTADGRRAISTSEEMTLKVWDVDTGAELHTLFGHSRGVKCVAMAPDCRRALSASADGTVKVWDLDTGAELRTLTGHPGYVHALAVTQDGRRAVSASSGQALKVWELDTGAELSTLSGWSAPAAGVAVTPYYLQIVDDRGTGGLRVWNPLPAVDVYTIRGDTGPIAAVACTPDGRLAVSASSDQRLRVWDVASAEALCTFRAESGLSACATAPDGVTCVAGDEGGGVHLLRLENVPPGPTLCTAWLSASGEAPAFGCLHCRVWSEVSEEDLGTELPCPNCGKAAKLNPFTVDADWRPVAATWSGLPGTRRETPLSPTPCCHRESTPAPLAPQPMSAHLKRLRADYEAITREFSDHPKITVTPLHGDPPDIYEVTYNIVGLELDVITVRPRKRSQHKVRFYLHSAYPEEMPKCVVETPIFHPNLTSLGCVDDSAPWTPETGLVDLVVHIGRMIAYQRYDVRFPMDAVAARWAETNANLFPIDDSDIAGPSPTEGAP